jgi:8-oxo-dGTP pyrophosphatase MutT (NUDIX family)
MKLASGIGIIYRDLILLAKRIEQWGGNPVPLGGYWSIFAGSLEGEESFQDCAIRETYEETEIKIDNYQLIDGCIIKNNKLRFKVFFVEMPYKPIPILNAEHTEYEWFDINKIKDFPYSIQEDLIKCIENYKNGV